MEKGLVLLQVVAEQARLISLKVVKKYFNFEPQFSFSFTVIEPPPNHGSGPPRVSPKTMGSRVNEYPPPPPPAAAPMMQQQQQQTSHMSPAVKSPGPGPAPKPKPKKKSIPNEGTEQRSASPNGASGFPPEWEEELANLPPWKRAMREKKMREEMVS